MPLDRKDYSFLERQRESVAEIEAAIQNPAESGTAPIHAVKADSYYADRQRRMDDTARAVMANLWCTHRPTVINEAANETLRQLACESWQIALALEQTRIGYDCAAMQGKRRDAEAVAKETVHNVD